jgi:CheY-like chemotaxis protein
VPTILVVDDAQTDRELMACVVHAAGHRALIAGDGCEAIALAKRHRPSLIFLDVAMPVMDGFATCRRLASDPETRAIPVVLVSPRSSPGDASWPSRQRGRDHVAKPWDSHRIEDLIRHYCP